MTSPRGDGLSEHRAGARGVGRRRDSDPGRNGLVVVPRAGHGHGRHAVHRRGGTDVIGHCPRRRTRGPQCGAPRGSPATRPAAEGQSSRRRGRLGPRPHPANQVLQHTDGFDGAGLWWVPVDHAGNRNISEEEVAIVERLIDQLARPGARWIDEASEAQPLQPSDIRVVAS